MIKRLIFSTLLFGAFSGQLFGQEAELQENVSYDPSFWAQELKLDAEQRSKIEVINAEFYEQLKNRPSLTQLQTYLQERQELILDTFHARQKRKWEKDCKYALINSPANPELLHQMVTATSANHLYQKPSESFPAIQHPLFFVVQG
jgi:hypothetical protein